MLLTNVLRLSNDIAVDARVGHARLLGSDHEVLAQVKYLCCEQLADVICNRILDGKATLGDARLLLSASHRRAHLSKSLTDCAEKQRWEQRFSFVLNVLKNDYGAHNLPVSAQDLKPGDIVFSLLYFDDPTSEDYGVVIDACQDEETVSIRWNNGLHDEYSLAYNRFLIIR